MDLTNKVELIDYLKSNGLYTKDSLGQNFLVDREVLEKIVETADIHSDDMVLEVGPGVGTLTRELINRAGKVIAVEMDDRLAELLISNQIPNQNDQKLKVINDDILKLNLSEVIGDREYKVVANIPYYITSKILQLFLTAKNKPESITLLVQKEVAERICAKPGQLSVLAISVQAYGEPEIVDIVKASSFFPAPAVDSAILKIKNIHPFCHPALDAGSCDSSTKDSGSRAAVRNDSYCEEKDFFRLVHVGFASKRKTLVNNLAAGLRLDKEKCLDIIKSVGLGEAVRAQELSIEEWVKLTQNQELRIRNKG